MSTAAPGGAVLLLSLLLVTPVVQGSVDPYIIRDVNGIFIHRNLYFARGLAFDLTVTANSNASTTAVVAIYHAGACSSTETELNANSNTTQIASGGLGTGSVSMRVQEGDTDASSLTLCAKSSVDSKKWLLLGFYLNLPTVTLGGTDVSKGGSYVMTTGTSHTLTFGGIDNYNAYPSVGYSTAGVCTFTFTSSGVSSVDVSSDAVGSMHDLSPPKLCFSLLTDTTSVQQTEIRLEVLELTQSATMLTVPNSGENAIAVTGSWNAGHSLTSAIQSGDLLQDVVVFTLRYDAGSVSAAATSVSVSASQVDLTFNLATLGLSSGAVLSLGLTLSVRDTSYTIVTSVAYTVSVSSAITPTPATATPTPTAATSSPPTGAPSPTATPVPPTPVPPPTNPPPPTPVPPAPPTVTESPPPPTPPPTPSPTSAATIVSIAAVLGGGAPSGSWVYPGTAGSPELIGLTSGMADVPFSIETHNIGDADTEVAFTTGTCGSGPYKGETIITASTLHVPASMRSVGTRVMCIRYTSSAAYSDTGYSLVVAPFVSMLRYNTDLSNVSDSSPDNRPTVFALVGTTLRAKVSLEVIGDLPSEADATSHTTWFRLSQESCKVALPSSHSEWGQLTDFSYSPSISNGVRQVGTGTLRLLSPMQRQGEFHVCIAVGSSTKPNDGLFFFDINLLVVISGVRIAGHDCPGFPLNSASGSGKKSLLVYQGHLPELSLQVSSFSGPAGYARLFNGSEWSGLSVIPAAQGGCGSIYSSTSPNFAEYAGSGAGQLTYRVTFPESYRALLAAPGTYTLCVGIVRQHPGNWATHLPSASTLRASPLVTFERYRSTLLQVVSAEVVKFGGIVLAGVSGVRSSQKDWPTFGLFSGSPLTVEGYFTEGSSLQQSNFADTLSESSARFLVASSPKGCNQGDVVGPVPASPAQHVDEFLARFPVIPTTWDSAYICVAVKTSITWGSNAATHFVPIPLKIVQLPYGSVNGIAASGSHLVVTRSKMVVCYITDPCWETFAAAAIQVGFPTPSPAGNATAEEEEELLGRDAVALSVATTANLLKSRLRVSHEGGGCADLTLPGQYAPMARDAKRWFYELPNVTALSPSEDYEMCIVRDTGSTVEVLRLPLELQRIMLTVQGHAMGSGGVVAITGAANSPSAPLTFLLSTSVQGSQSRTVWLQFAPLGGCGNTSKSGQVEGVSTNPFYISACQENPLPYASYAKSVTSRGDIEICIGLSTDVNLQPDVNVFESAGLFYKVDPFPTAFKLLESPGFLNYNGSLDRNFSVEITDDQGVVTENLPADVTVYATVWECRMEGVEICITNCENNITNVSNAAGVDLTPWTNCTQECEALSMLNCTDGWVESSIIPTLYLVRASSYSAGSRAVSISFPHDVRGKFRYWYRFGVVGNVGGFDTLVSELYSDPFKLIGCYNWRAYDTELPFDVLITLSHPAPRFLQRTYGANQKDHYLFSKYAEPYTSNCNLCPQGGRCDGTTELRTMDNFWRANIMSLRFYSCDKPKGTLACTDNTTTGTCRSGYRPHMFDWGLFPVTEEPDSWVVQDDNPLCTLCDTNHGRQGSVEGLCGRCTAAWKSWVVTCSVTVIVVVALMGMVLSTLRSSRDMKKNELAIMLRMFLTYVSVASLTGNSGELYTALLKDVFGIQQKASGQVVGDIAAFDCLFPDFNYFHQFSFIMAMPLIFTILLGFAFGPLLHLVKQFFMRKKNRRNIIRELAWFGTKKMNDVKMEDDRVVEMASQGVESPRNLGALLSSGGCLSPLSLHSSKGKSDPDNAEGGADALSNVSIPIPNVPDVSQASPLAGPSSSLQVVVGKGAAIATDVLHTADSELAELNTTYQEKIEGALDVLQRVPGVAESRRSSKAFDQKNLETIRKLADLFDSLDRNKNELLSKFELKSAFEFDTDIQKVIRSKFDGDADLFWDSLLPETANQFGVTKDRFIQAMSEFEHQSRKILPGKGLLGGMQVEREDSDALSVIDEHEDELGAMLGFKSDELKKAYFASMVIFLTIIYPTVLETAAKFLQCETYDYGSITNATSFLPRGETEYAIPVNRTVFRHDARLDCDDPAFKDFRITAIILMVFYGAGLPIGSVVALRFIRGPQTVPANETPEERQRRKQGLKNARMMFGFLMAGYTKQCWYWEAVVMVRKSLMVFISVYVRNTLSTYAAMWTVSICCLLQVRFEPYIHKNLNRLEQGSLLAIAITLNLSLLYHRDSGNLNPDSPGIELAAFWSLTLLLLVANIALLVVFLYWIAYYFLEFVAEVALDQLVWINRVGGRLHPRARLWLMRMWRGDVLYARSVVTGKRRIVKDGCTPMLLMAEQKFLGTLRQKLANVIFLRRQEITPWEQFTEDDQVDTGSPPPSPVARAREYLSVLGRLPCSDITIESRVRIAPEYAELEGNHDTYGEYEIPKTIRILTPLCGDEVFAERGVDHLGLPTWASPGGRVMYSTGVQRWAIAEAIGSEEPFYTSAEVHDDRMPHVTEQWLGRDSAPAAVRVTAPADGAHGTVIAIDERAHEARVFWDVTCMKCPSNPNKTYVLPIDHLELVAPDTGSWLYLAGTDCLFRGVHKVGAFIRWKAIQREPARGCVGSKVRIMSVVKSAPMRGKEDDPLKSGTIEYAESCKLSWPYDKREDGDQLGCLRDGFGTPGTRMVECSFDAAEQVAVGMNGQYDASSALISRVGYGKAIEFYFWLPSEDPVMCIEPLVYTESKVGYGGFVHDFHSKEPGFQACVRLLTDTGEGFMKKPPPPPPVDRKKAKKTKKVSDDSQVVNAVSYDDELMDVVLGDEQHDSDDDLEQNDVDMQAAMRQLEEQVARQQTELEELRTMQTDQKSGGDEVAVLQQEKERIGELYMQMVDDLQAVAQQRDDANRQQKKKDRVYQHHIRKLKGRIESTSAKHEEATQTLRQVEEELRNVNEANDALTAQLQRVRELQRQTSEDGSDTQGAWVTLREISEDAESASSTLQGLRKKDLVETVHQQVVSLQTYREEDKLREEAIERQFIARMELATVRRQRKQDNVKSLVSNFMRRRQSDTARKAQDHAAKLQEEVDQERRHVESLQVKLDEALRNAKVQSSSDAEKLQEALRMQEELLQIARREVTSLREAVHEKEVMLTHEQKVRKELEAEKESRRLMLLDIEDSVDDEDLNADDEDDCIAELETTLQGQVEELDRLLGRRPKTGEVGWRPRKQLTAAERRRRVRELVHDSSSAHVKRMKQATRR